MKEPIRIAQIIGKWVGGGVEAVVMNYYRNIDHSKIQFDFICDNDSTNIPYEEIESLGGKVILIPPYQKVLSYHKQLKKVLKENNYKIVHSHINTLSVFSLFAAKCAGVPVRIAHSHSTIVNNRREWKRNLMKNVLKHFSKTFATDYFACSEMAAISQFGKKTFDKGQVTIINNAIDLNKFKFNEKVRTNKRQELNIVESTLVIGHLGRFVETKNHKFLIDIFNEIYKKNNDSILLLAGQGPLEEEIKNKVKELKLENNVRFLGQRNDANELYQVFDVFLLPSLYEGLPVVGVEAQASGILCYLSSDMTKETKVLDSTKFMTLDQTPEEWATNILNDIKNYKRKDTKEEISNNNFNIKNESIKLEDKYLKLCKKKVVHLICTDVFSGAENVACQIINAFDNENYEMTYVSKLGSNKKSLIDRNINYYELKEFSYREVKKAIKSLKPDIIHAHDAKAICMGSIFSKSSKVIGQIHGNHENMRVLSIKTILLNLCSKRVNKFIWVSKSALDDYKFKNKIKDKSIVLYNVINAKQLRKRVKEDCNVYKKYDLIFLGRLSYPKNPQRLVRLIYMIAELKKDLKVAIVGSGEYDLEIKNMINALELEDNIDMFGFQSNPYKILCNSKLMVMTSRYEGTPMCALEAFSLGIPIITTPTDGLVDIINNNIDGYYSNNDEELKNKIIELLNNKDLFNNMKNNVLNKSNKINNINKYKKEISNIY